MVWDFVTLQTVFVNKFGDKSGKEGSKNHIFIWHHNWTTPISQKFNILTELNSFFIINGMTSVSSENCESCGAVNVLRNTTYVIMI